MCNDNPFNFLHCQMHGQKTAHVLPLPPLKTRTGRYSLLCSWGKGGTSPTEVTNFEGAFLAHSHFQFPDDYVLAQSGEPIAVTSEPFRPLWIEHRDRNGTKVGQSHSCLSVWE